MNHSCQPNAQFERFVWLGKQRIVLAAQTIIEAGDEVTVDYGDTYWQVRPFLSPPMHLIIERLLTCICFDRIWTRSVAAARQGADTATAIRRMQRICSHRRHRPRRSEQHLVPSRLDMKGERRDVGFALRNSIGVDQLLLPLRTAFGDEHRRVPYARSTPPTKCPDTWIASSALARDKQHLYLCKSTHNVAHTTS